MAAIMVMTLAGFWITLSSLPSSPPPTPPPASPASAPPSPPPPPPMVQRRWELLHVEGIPGAANISHMPVIPGCLTCGGEGTPEKLASCPFRSEDGRFDPGEWEAYSVDVGQMWDVLDGGRLWSLTRDMGGGRREAGKLELGRSTSSIRCCGVDHPKGQDHVQAYDDVACLLERVRFAGLEYDEGFDEYLGAEESAPGPLIRFQVELFDPEGGGDGVEPIVVGSAGGIWDWRRRLYLSVSVEEEGVAFDPSRESLCPGGVVEDRILVVMQDPFVHGSFWHNFHNLFVRGFAALANLEDGIVTCNVEWPEGCRIKREATIISLPGTISDPGEMERVVPLVERLSDVPVMGIPPDSSCYSRILFGLSGSVNFNHARISPRSIALAHHLARFEYYKATGSSLPSVWGPNGLVTAVEERPPLLVIVVRKVRVRSFTPDTMEMMVRVARSRGLPFEIVTFESSAKEDRERAYSTIRRATIIFGVSGAGFVNLVYMHPGTVVIDLFAPEAFTYSLKLYEIFTILINTMGGTIISYNFNDPLINYAPEGQRDSIIRLSQVQFESLLEAALAEVGVGLTEAKLTLLNDQLYPGRVYVVRPDPGWVEGGVGGGVLEWPPVK